MYPLLQLGIYEDLRGRLRSHKPRYSCLVAIQPASTCDRASHTNHSHTSDTIVGTVEIAYKSAYPWQTQHYAGPYIANLAVHQHYRRRGIALKLLQVCEQTAKDWGFNQLYLHVLETNAPARRLYRKAGYEEQAKESGLSSWLLGQPQRLLLRKTLSI
jgi:ribosomal protein S18 acetylase RimI-like enzyme